MSKSLTQTSFVNSNAKTLKTQGALYRHCISLVDNVDDPAWCVYVFVISTDSFKYSSASDINDDGGFWLATGKKGSTSVYAIQFRNGTCYPLNEYGMLGSSFYAELDDSVHQIR